MDKNSRFHFIEIDWLLYFPINGNEGRKYPMYGVAYRDRKKGVSQKGPRIYLEEVLNETEIREKYPHTVGYYVDSSGKGPTFKPKYEEKRIVKNVEEFYTFLSDLSASRRL